MAVGVPGRSAEVTLLVSPTASSLSILSDVVMRYSLRDKLTATAQNKAGVLWLAWRQFASVRDI